MSGNPFSTALSISSYYELYIDGLLSVLTATDAKMEKQFT